MTEIWPFVTPTGAGGGGLGKYSRILSQARNQKDTGASDVFLPN